MLLGFFFSSESRINLPINCKSFIFGNYELDCMKQNRYLIQYRAERCRSIFHVAKLKISNNPVSFLKELSDEKNNETIAA